MARRPQALSIAALALVAVLGLGCVSAAAWLVMPFAYEEAELPANHILRDLAYVEGEGADPQKHRLDLYVPPDAAARPWPVMVFVHGGGWTSGDRAMRAGGHDVYGNIGRYFAAHGVAAAVISYRLQFEVDWRDQVDDVDRAVAWVRRNIPRYGGDPRAIFVSGHSAGAYLATRVAFDRRQTHPGDLCGVIPISGSGYDLTDTATHGLGPDRAYFEKRFGRDDPGDDWMREASSIPLLTPQAPPSLVLYAERDFAALRHQAQLLHRALDAVGVENELVKVDGENHLTVILALSRDGNPATRAMLGFIQRRRARCAPPDHDPTRTAGESDQAG